jgi:YwhD family
MEKLSLTGKSKHAVDDQMKGLSALFLDGEHVLIDNGAIHAKSRLERGVTWVRTPQEIQNGRLIPGLWVTLHRFEHGQGYYGAMPFSLLIDEATQTGYKNLTEQVNHMDKAVRGNVNVDPFNDAQLLQISTFLKSIREDLWNNATKTFRDAFDSSMAPS